MFRDYILRLHIVHYIIKYPVKFENFHLRSTEFVVQTRVLNNNLVHVIRRLEKTVWQKSTYFFNDPRNCNMLFDWLKNRLLSIINVAYVKVRLT